MLLCRITGTQLLTASAWKESCAVRYLLSPQPVAECQRFLRIHGESWTSKSTQKIKIHQWNVILLNPHHRCPTPKTRRPPHPPFPPHWRMDGWTDAPPRLVSTHGCIGEFFKDAKDGISQCRWFCRRLVFTEGKYRCLTLCFRREGRSCAWCHASPAPKLLVW